MAVRAGVGLIPTSWERAKDTHPRRWVLYGAAGLLATVLIGPWLVLVLLACGAFELLRRRPGAAGTALGSWTFEPMAAVATGGVGALASFSFILLGAERFDRLRSDARARAFLDGAGPAAIGAILGSAIPLALALEEPWQLVVLALAAVALLWARRGVVTTLLTAALIGAVVGLAGGQLPG